MATIREMLDPRTRNELQHRLEDAERVERKHTRRRRKRTYRR